MAELHMLSALQRMAAATLVAAAAAMLGGCSLTSRDITGSIGRATMRAPDPAADPAPTGTDAQASTRAEGWRRYTEAWGKRYKDNGADPEAAVNYARGLRVIGSRAQAVAVLEQAAIRNPRNAVVLAAYGRALADAGQLEQALQVLGNAHRPDRPDWRILNAQGAVLDQLGRPAEARRYYAAALKIAPDEASILSNLGLSYILTKELTKAEEALRRAAADPKADAKVRQNLALALGLQGKFAEAERIAAQDLSGEELARAVAYWKRTAATKAAATAG